MTPLRLIRGTIVASLASKFATCLFYDRVFISFIVARSFDVRRGSEASVTSIRRCKVGLMCHLLAITRNKSFRSEPLHRDPLWHLDNDHSRFRATMVMHFSSIFHIFSFSLLFLFFPTVYIHRGNISRQAVIVQRNTIRRLIDRGYAQVATTGFQQRRKTSLSFLCLE